MTHAREMVTRQIILEELRERCRWRPAKRAALQVASILMQERQRPWDLVRAERLLAELIERVQRARV